MDSLSLLIIEMKKDMREMDAKIDRLLEFRWKVVGGSMVISGLIALAFEVAHLVMK